MNRKHLALFITFFSFATLCTSTVGAEGVEIRTFVGMEPYGRMTVKNWGLSGQVERWDAGYGITPGIEVLTSPWERIEIGGGVRCQVPRRVLRSGGAADESFYYIPLYATGRFDIIDTVGIDMYGSLRLGYTFLLSNQEFRDIWLDETTGLSLAETGGGFYGGASLGVIFNLVARENWNLDWSMDAGYSYHGGTGRNTSGKGFIISYQALSADFSLDWNF